MQEPTNKLLISHSKLRCGNMQSHEIKAQCQANVPICLDQRLHEPSECPIGTAAQRLDNLEERERES